MSGQRAPAPPGDADLALRLEGVTAKFTSGPVSLIAVNDVSFALNEGEILARAQARAERLAQQAGPRP